MEFPSKTISPPLQSTNHTKSKNPKEFKETKTPIKLTSILILEKKMPRNSKPISSQLISQSQKNDVEVDDDDDFQTPLSQSRTPFSLASSSNRNKHLNPSSSNVSKPGPRPPPSKKPKPTPYRGKENIDPNVVSPQTIMPRFVEEEIEPEDICGLEMIESTFDCSLTTESAEKLGKADRGGELEAGEGYLRNSIESRLVRSWILEGQGGGEISESSVSEEEDELELDALLKLCNEEGGVECEGFVECPLCGADISGIPEEARLVHTNDCLDKDEGRVQEEVARDDDDERGPRDQPEVVDGPDRALGKNVAADDVSAVVDWLRNLGLERYEADFVREEVDWETLLWLTEEDLLGIGMTALGPRKRIVRALDDLKKGHSIGSETNKISSSRADVEPEASKVVVNEVSKVSATKLITDYFPGSFSGTKKIVRNPGESIEVEKSQKGTVDKRRQAKTLANHRKPKDIPPWCNISGTPFRVDAFKYLRGDCSHWFLTHFHMDHYQGLTKSFCHGKIYCSLITAKLVNMKIGIPWARLEVLPLNQKVDIGGVNVICFDANHCPGAIIILFEPPNGKAVLHTGDFRFCEKMASMADLQTRRIHTLVLDTTYCDPQYDFPKQEAVIQFVIEAIQAETFNPKTLFLIGSYMIGKERVFLEVARVLRRKVYVNAAKFRVLECLGFTAEDMQWFTLNEQESQIHVVPMWTLASFKRLKHVANQYSGRYNLIVAFSPTGWTFGKGKKKSPGRRSQQGTIIRYEVPYSEHSSFTELREFVKLVSPEKVIPSVNNYGPDSANKLVSLLVS